MTTQALTEADKRLIDTIYAEVGGGSPEEVAAVVSVFLNRAKKQGIDKALRGSSAYRLGSKEYKKASSGQMNAYERKVYDRNKIIVNQLVNDPAAIAPYTYFENVNAFGEPSWARDMASYKDIGRQRFYTEKPNPRAVAVGR